MNILKVTAAHLRSRSREGSRFDSYPQGVLRVPKIKMCLIHTDLFFESLFSEMIHLFI